MSKASSASQRKVSPAMQGYLALRDYLDKMARDPAVIRAYVKTKGDAASPGWINRMFAEGLTNSALAKFLGVSGSTMNMYRSKNVDEQEDRIFYSAGWQKVPRPSDDLLAKFAKAFGVDVVILRDLARPESSGINPQLAQIAADTDAYELAKEIVTLDAETRYYIQALIDAAKERLATANGAK